MATETRDLTHPDTGRVVWSPPTSAGIPPVGGLVGASGDHDDDAPVNDLLGSAPSGAVATDFDDARATISCTEMNKPASSSSAPLETHRGPAPARLFPVEPASSRKQTVAVVKAPGTAGFEPAFADPGIETTELDAELDTPASSSPDTSLVIGGPDDARALSGGAGDDGKALERRVAGSPDSVLGDASTSRAPFFDSDSSADEADVRPSPLFSDSEAVHGHAVGTREASSDERDIAEDDDARPDAKTEKKKAVSFAAYSAWSVHDIGSCRDLSREKLAPTRGAGFLWLAKPSGIGLRWLKQGLSAFGVFGGGGTGGAGFGDGNGDGFSRRSAAGKQCLVKRALRESRRNMRENVDYNLAYADAVDGLNRAAEREAKARRYRERRRRQSARL